MRKEFSYLSSLSCREITSFKLQAVAVSKWGCQDA